MNGYKTLIGAFIALLAEGARLTGIDLGDQTALVQSVLAIGGAALAVYGRVVATKRVGGGDLQ